jgi:hypothetical protein
LTAPTNLRFSSETTPPELWLNWDPSTDDTDSQALILYETYPERRPRPGRPRRRHEHDRVLPGRGPTIIVLRAVDTSGNRSGPSNELSITC